MAALAYFQGRSNSPVPKLTCICTFVINLRYLGAPRLQPLPSLLSELDVDACPSLPLPTCSASTRKICQCIGQNKLQERGQVWTSGLRPWSNETLGVHAALDTSQRVRQRILRVAAWLLGYFSWCAGPGSNLAQVNRNLFGDVSGNWVNFSKPCQQ